MVQEPQRGVERTLNKDSRREASRRVSSLLSRMEINAG